MAAEGKNKTEKYYFSDFAKEYNKNVEFISSDYTDPINMVKALIEKYDAKGMSEENGDTAYCLIDSDFNSQKDNQIANADNLAKAKNKNVDILVSNPCFEIWFICHYTASTRQYISSKEVLSKLREYHQDYEKNSREMFKKTKGNLSIALENAMKLRRSCEDNGYKIHTIKFTPSTEIDKLVRRLME